MSNKQLIALLVVLAVVVIGIILLVGGSENIDTTPDGDIATTTQDTPDLITAQHQFSDGTHIVAGEIEMPTPCDLLDWDTVIDDESDPQAVTIQFASTNEEEMCAQVVTSQRFKAEFDAPENAEIQATFNGEPVELNIMDVGSDVNLEDFEIFIKG